MCASLKAQKLTDDMIGEFMLNGSLTIKTIRKDTVREIAHSIEFPKYLMAWLPGKDFSDSVNAPFELTSAYVPTSDLTWSLSSPGGYIFLEPGDFSERIVGIKTDEHTIEAYSDMTRCRFLIRRK